MPGLTQTGAGGARGGSMARRPDARKIRHWTGDLAHPPVLVGEDNPYGGRPANALLPEPVGSAGWRLCVKIFGMDPRQYMLAFVRYNLCVGRWNTAEAERRAHGLGLLYRENPK